jgi:FKBP-type peptidyl-prolyl cis-trans isomerase FklB
MNKTTIAIALVLASTALVACKDSKPETEEAKVAYSLGFITGKSSVEHAPDLDTKAFIQGFKDAHDKKEGKLTEKEIEDTLTAYQKKMMEQASAKAEKEGKAQEAANKKLLDDNAKKAGVTTTASGLQYEILSEGKGAKPKATDKVKVHYEGKLTDGKVFDSSRQRGEPVTFRLDQVIPGWTEGLQLMPVGSVYRFTIPSHLAYGPQGAGPIPPNSVLVFEVELLGIEK